MSKESKTIRENFQIFGVATFLFACLYSVRYCGKQFGFAAKKGTLFYGPGVSGSVLLET